MEQVWGVFSEDIIESFYVTYSLLGIFSSHEAAMEAIKTLVEPKFLNAEKYYEYDRRELSVKELTLDRLC